MVITYKTGQVKFWHTVSNFGGHLETGMTFMRYTCEWKQAQTWSNLCALETISVCVQWHWTGWTLIVWRFTWETLAPPCLELSSLSLVHLKGFCKSNESPHLCSCGVARDSPSTKGMFARLHFFCMVDFHLFKNKIIGSIVNFSHSWIITKEHGYTMLHSNIPLNHWINIVPFILSNRIYIPLKRERSARPICDTFSEASDRSEATNGEGQFGGQSGRNGGVVEGDLWWNYDSVS